MKAGCYGAIVSALLLFLLSGCGGIDLGRHLPQGAPSGAPVERPTLPSPESKTVSPLPEIHRNLETEEYRSALNLLRKAVDNGASETALAAEYGRALNGLLAQAERSREQGLLGKTGTLYRAALDGFPETADVAEQVEYSTLQIQERIEACAGELMEQGLIAYRAGDLDVAIRTWETIHTFDPDHEASLKALETAKVQRDNLERVDFRR